MSTILWQLGVYKANILGEVHLEMQQEGFYDAMTTVKQFPKESMHRYLNDLRTNSDLSVITLTKSFLNGMFLSERQLI